MSDIVTEEFPQLNIQFMTIWNITTLYSIILWPEKSFGHFESSNVSLLCRSSASWARRQIPPDAAALWLDVQVVSSASLVFPSWCRGQCWGFWVERVLCCPPVSQLLRRGEIEESESISCWMLGWKCRTVASLTAKCQIVSEVIVSYRGPESQRRSDGDTSVDMKWNIWMYRIQMLPAAFSGHLEEKVGILLQLTAKPMTSKWRLKWWVWTPSEPQWASTSPVKALSRSSDQFQWSWDVNKKRTWFVNPVQLIFSWTHHTDEIVSVQTDSLQCFFCKYSLSLNLMLWQEHV